MVFVFYFPRAAALTENAPLCCLASMFKLLHKHWEEDVNLSFHKKSNFDLKDIVTNVVNNKGNNSIFVDIDF